VGMGEERGAYRVLVEKLEGKRPLGRLRHRLVDNIKIFFQWSRGSVLAFSTQVRGFKPGRSRRIFRAKKILSTPSFRGEVKPLVPCRRFEAYKRSLNLRGSRNLGKITGHLSLSHSSTFRC
jgi:hypothetical protein